MMKPSPQAPLSPARHVAHKLLTRFEKPAQLDAVEHRPEALLAEALTTATLSLQDAALCRHLLLSTLRYWLPTQGWLVQHLGKQGLKALPPQGRTALRMALTEAAVLDTPPHALSSQLVALCKRLGLNPKQQGCLLAVLQPLLELSTPEARQTALRQATLWPPALVAHLQQHLPHTELGAWPAVAQQLALAITTPPCLALRLSDAWLNSPTPPLAEAAEAHGWQVTHPYPEYPAIVQVAGAKGSPTTWAGYADGAWVIQDPASALVAYQLHIKAGDTVIDACAAPGTKTTLLAQRLAGTGQLIALDTKASRLAKLHDNWERLKLPTHNLQVLVADATQWQPEPTQLADAVLLDAPCSGLGTLAKHPEGVLRWQPETQTQTVALQRALLNNASQWVKQGGHLVYSVCSFLPDEGSLLVQAWLAEHPAWVCEKQALTLPQAGLCDGFYWALLRKS
jgi:16S rRNA (cytosine967-C5)-methyltransferase